eukprot:jgi/Picre1/31878/NNA_007226.t1
METSAGAEKHKGETAVVVLVLVGLQGSGKTTFRSRLEQCNSLEVVGVCQDVLGTREKCLCVFRRALSDREGPEGKALGNASERRIRFVVVDRTNLSKEQRRIWTDEIKRAQGGTVGKSLALFWDMPAKFCAKRAADRKTHEGGLQGRGAYPVVHQSSKGLQRPDVEEDFDSVVTFTCDEHAFAFADHLIAVNKEFKDTGILHVDTKVHRKGRRDAFQILMSQRKKSKKTLPSSSNEHTFGRFRGWDTFVKYTSSVPQEALFSDEECIVISDKFPKAKTHILAIARCGSLQGPLDLRPRHTGLLRHMKDVSYQVLSTLTDATIEQIKQQNMYRMGFHSSPSLSQLHMHVISKDFDSEYLKTKKHWTSFTNPQFFLNVDDVLAQFERGIPALDYNVEEKNALLRNTRLTCPVCQCQTLRTLPEMKDHYRQCFTRGS